MPLINFTNPIAVLIGTVLFLLVLYLARETKKSWIMGLFLVASLGILIGHIVEFSTIGTTSELISRTTLSCAVVDLVLVFLSFMTYLWIDDMEVKAGKKKSIDNSLDWFWNKI